MVTRIRKISQDELSEFTKAVRRGLLGDYPDFSPRVKEFFLREELSLGPLSKAYASQRVTLWGAFIANRIAGYLMALKPYGGVSFLAWLGVLREHQGQGIGTKLLLAHEKWVKSQGVHALHLYSSKDTLPFYKKLGFKDVGLSEKGYFGVSDHLMTKLLQEPNEQLFCAPSPARTKTV